MTQPFNPANLANGREHYEYAVTMGRKCTYYDYRALDGELFACASVRGIDDCRAQRDEWLRETGRTAELRA